MAATPRTPAALATYLVEAAPVGAAELAPEAAAEVASEAVLAAELKDASMSAREQIMQCSATYEAAFEVARLEVCMLLEAELELVLTGGAELDPETLEALEVIAPPGVEEPELVKLCPTQLVSLPLWMGSSLE